MLARKWKLSRCPPHAMHLPLPPVAAEQWNGQFSVYEHCMCMFLYQIRFHKSCRQTEILYSSQHPRVACRPIPLLFVIHSLLVLTVISMLQGPATCTARSGASSANAQQTLQQEYPKSAKLSSGACNWTHPFAVSAQHIIVTATLPLSHPVSALCIETGRSVDRDCVSLGICNSTWPNEALILAGASGCYCNNYK